MQTFLNGMLKMGKYVENQGFDNYRGVLIRDIKENRPPFYRHQ